MTASSERASGGGGGGTSLVGEDERLALPEASARSLGAKKTVMAYIQSSDAVSSSEAAEMLSSAIETSAALISSAAVVTPRRMLAQASIVLL